MRATDVVWKMSKLVDQQLSYTSLSWKGFVGYLVPVHFPWCKRKNYTSWIMYGIAFISSLAEADTIESMWHRTCIGTGLIQLGGGGRAGGS